jgi:hypothetical protein
LTETRHQRLHDFRRNRCCGIVVEIEMLHLASFYQ